ncbi:MAG: hypothetical protein JNK84_16975 [Phreatobacter sp.]|uniref:hypothetical protein n=1 Tax=Phreatobacter sp. TaxID=1966341 RepID=UPI001A4098FF|nr:hypothetical protein [Phreatobacter sp.]MBL8570766.1 hypothetical protein [Phreatobacter sp.]
MSMELYVLSDRQLTSIAEWQAAIDQEGFRLKLDEGAAFTALDGYLPAHFGAALAGFEVNHWDPQAMKRDDPEYVDFVKDEVHLLAFRWGGSEHELFGVFAAASAYARATGGWVFDCESGEAMTPDATAELARKFEADLPRAA